MTTPTTAIARVDSAEVAQETVDALIDAHVPNHDIEVLLVVGDEVEEHALAYQNGMFPGLTGGAALGAIGTALGATLAAGPVGIAWAVALTSGALVGATGGGLVGLAWWDHVLDEETKAAFDDGSVWVAVRNPAHVPQAAQVLMAHASGPVRTMHESPEALMSR